MTNYKQSVKNGKRGSNKKDGATGRRQPRQDWESHGFITLGWNKHTYTWEGNFPVFTISPGIASDRAGLVAKCGEVTELFPYGTDPAEIKTRLDDLIYEDLQADAEEIDWAEWEDTGLAYSFDDWMATMERSEAGA